MQPKSENHTGWTLFLDRDGVLNERPGNAYVRKPEDFVWKNGSLQALKLLKSHFDQIIVVTNQQGIGKGLMTTDDLSAVHRKMLADVKKEGGHIDAVYFAAGMRHPGSFLRKPAHGMFLQAIRDFPGIAANKSIMAGDTFSDMLFGYRLNMYTALIANTRPYSRHYWHTADFHFNDLAAFARFILRHQTHPTQ